MSKEPKTKVCKYCNTEIPANTKVCPNCNKKQSTKTKWIIIGIIVLLLIGAVSGNGNTSNNVETTTSANVLMTSELKVVDVMNGFGDTVLGQRAYIEITDAELTALTLEDFQEFANDIVKDSGYRCVTIITDSGKAIFFPASSIIIAEYGKIGEEGLLSEVLGFIQLQDDGSTYLYTPKE